MKILYGIQGTGHGHISRARELLPELSKYADVDVLISGYNCSLNLDGPVTYRKYGISMTYDSCGGVSILDTLRALRPIRFLADIQSIPIEDYDLVISDYEPVTAWSSHTTGTTGIALSHQASFLSERAPRPEKRSRLAETILQHLAPADHAIGFHFKRYDTFIEPPIIRSDILKLVPEKGNHVTVYLPAYDPDMLSSIFKKIGQVEWHLFSPECEGFKKEWNVSMHSVSHEIFLESFSSCRGVITSSGFEMCAEAMYLGKKLLTVPIKNQYEQLCNAAALEQMGVTVLRSIPDRVEEIEEWIGSGEIVRLNEIAEVRDLVPMILSKANYYNHRETARQLSELDTA